MEEIASVEIVVGGGLEGDHKGKRFPKRGVTILAREAWQAAVDELTDLAGPVSLPWTTRRANLLVEGTDLRLAPGSIVAVGAVRLEVMAETYPCRRMDEAHRGLLRALAQDGRGGVTCRVLEGGQVTVGDSVAVLSFVERKRPRLP